MRRSCGHSEAERTGRSSSPAFTAGVRGGAGCISLWPRRPPGTIGPPAPRLRAAHCRARRKPGLTTLEAEKMTTLVTGGAGFIGSHLTESLLAGGEDVI